MADEFMTEPFCNVWIRQEDDSEGGIVFEEINGDEMLSLFKLVRKSIKKGSNLEMLISPLQGSDEEL